MRYFRKCSPILQTMIPTITITLDPSNLVNNIIRTVHHYYPLGFEYMNEQYDGFLELKNIVKDKVLKGREGMLSAEAGKLKTKLEEKYPGLSIYFDFCSESPSYSISFPVTTQDFESLDRELIFSLKISLLSNYYTYFFVERVRHKTIFTRPGSFGHVSTVISQEGKQGDKEREMVAQVNSIFLDCFPSYQFVNHYHLFLMKVNGVPYGQDYNDPKRDYLLYDFLFESGMYINYTLVR